MVTRQKCRNARRQPLEELVRQALQDIARDRATVQIEVHDHDGMNGCVIWVHLKSPLDAGELEALQLELAAAAKSSIPAGHPMGTWSLVLQLAGQEISTVYSFET